MPAIILSSSLLKYIFQRLSDIYPKNVDIKRSMGE